MPYGEHHYSLDDKGRVVIPQAFRAFVEDGVVVTRGLERCLYIYPLVAWSAIEKNLQNIPLLDHQAQKTVRFLYSGAHKAQTDNASRLTIPEPLRQFAAIHEKNDVVIAGAPSRLEIWSSERWWQAINAFSDQPTISESLAGLIG